MAFSLEPWIEARDLSASGTPDWPDVDAVASAWVGQPCLAIPSIRVGLCWALGALGLARHRDHILVPRFMGRCILNAVSRQALPVEQPTSQTRIALVVDQFGCRQDRGRVVSECLDRGWGYLEDSPCGLAEDETPSEHSLGRFIGLAKAMPVVQGAILVTTDARIADEVRARRACVSAWTWPVWLTMLQLRRRREAASYSAVADAAYEMYVAAAGGNRWLRGNLLRAFEQADRWSAESHARMEAASSRLGASVRVPDVRRLAYVVPYLGRGDLAPARQVFRDAGFGDAIMHVDIAGNMFAPQFVPSLLMPVHARIPRASFDRLIDGLANLQANT